MAPHTAFGFLVLATGVLAATADRGLLSAYRRHLPPLAMFAALVLLLLAGAGAFRNARRMAETSAWVARTYQELALMEGILAGVQDIGAAHRGFVATGMETFLAPVAAARDALTRDLAALRLLSADSPEQERRVAALQPLITSRLAHAAETERLFRTRGAAAARAFIAAGAGERLVSGIRALVHDMKRSEEQLLNQRRADAAATTASSFLALGLAAAIGMAVLVGLFAALYRLNHALESRVAERTAALAASERQYRDLAETALVGIYRSTLRGDVLYVNKAMARMVGFDSPEAMIRSGALARWRNPEDRRAFLERLQRDGQVEASENVILTARGEPIHTLVSATIKGDELTGTVLDITERKRTEQEISTLNAELEQRVRDRTRQLEEVNSELESFSYSVSHDLRAPLRHIDGYAEMLEHTTDGQLTEQAQRYLRTIREASAEMGQLIDDLLAFARMGRAELHESCVHLNELVQEAIRGMEMATAGRNITWYVAPLPQVVGDQALLKQVLANLIGNAVKYSRTRDPARIEIGSAGEENGRVIVFVRDNGVGFDMQHADRLFGVFQRLHRAEEFEGTGVGLATVRRIVARHGGRVWAESAVNQGATFHFTLQRSRSA